MMCGPVAATVRLFNDVWQIYINSYITVYILTSIVYIIVIDLCS